MCAQGPVQRLRCLRPLGGEAPGGNHLSFPFSQLLYCPSLAGYCQVTACHIWQPFPYRPATGQEIRSQVILLKLEDTLENPRPLPERLGPAEP